MADAQLTVLKGGINRLRNRGGARADSLYDLLNGYVTDEGTAKARPGTSRDYTLPSTTRGMCKFGDSLHTFAAEVVAVPAGFTLHVLVHPDHDPGEAVIQLERIHFAEPLMGALYVVAEFEDGVVRHYWLQQGTEWAADTFYREGDIVTPTVSNGLAYRATRYGSPNPVWKAGTPRTVGDIVEPTDENANGYFYTVVDTAGSTPASGTIEPEWPAAEGARVTENTDLTGDPASEAASGDGSTSPGSDVTDRYGE